MVIASGVMDQRRPSPFGLPFGSSSSFFSEDQPIPERQVGFWKPESVVDQKGSNSVFSSPLEKTHPMNPASGLRNPEAETFKSQKDMLSLDNNLLGQEKASNQTSSTLGDVRTSHRSRLGLSLKESAFVEPTSVERCVPDYENGLFSCSSATFSSKLRLASSSAPGQSFDINNSSCEEDEPLGSMEEIEAQTIGDLLPNDDDLISGVIDDFEYTGLSTIPDDVDEDIFCTGGGMELENDDAVECAKSQERSLNCPLSHEHPSAEHPGRTLLVGNIDNSMEDSELRALFQQYGDIHKLYTSCKHRGFVIISYYDTRAAQNAIRALHNKPSGSRNLDVHFYITKDNLSDKDINQGTLVVSNVDSSVSNDDLCRIFSVYGEVKGIHEAPTKRNHKFIEFYDVRAAEAALHGLNKNNYLGQKIKLESGHLDGARYCLTQQCFIEQKNEQHGIFLQQPNNAPSACIGKLAPKSWENGSIHGLYSPTSPLVDKLLHGISSSVPQKLSSPIRIESIHQHSNQAGFGESGGSLDQRNFGRGMQVFHPHSLPEYQNTMCNNPKPMTPNGVHVSSRLAGVDCSRLHKVGSGSLHGHSFDQTEALGASGINSCPLHGHHYVWNSSNALPQNPSAPVLWSNLQHPIHVHGFPGVPRRMNTSVQHHLGTSPAYGGSFAEMHPYSRSLGSIGFPGGAQMYPSELSVFPPARGNSREAMFSPVSVGFPSPQQRSRVTIGRNPMNSSTLYDAPNDRMRSRRHDGNANQSDKKHFDLDIDRIAKGEDSRTTLMIKNIPNKYTCKMLLAVIDENHRGTYDFIYLPIDFKNKCNVGYAFINMTDPQHIIPFFKTFNGKKWEKFNSEKVASLAYARIQGRGALIAHFQNSSLMNEDKRCRPMLFHKDGPNAGDQEPFPVGNNVRSRSGRNRPFTNPDTQQGSPSTSPNRETSSSGTNSPSSSTEEPLE